MPCRYDEPNPSERQREAGRVAKLLQETTTGRHVDPAGYRRAVEWDTSVLDDQTREMCDRLTGWSEDRIRAASLELQTWWRDHQEADSRRRAEELRRQREESRRAHEAVIRRGLRQSGLAKLTDDERRALGLPTKDDDQ